MDVLERLDDRLNGLVDHVVGDPVERDGATVIPVVAVRAGGGGGSGRDPGSGADGSGGGWGSVARPVGAYVIRDGQVTYEPAIDVTRIVVGGQILAGLVVLAVWRVLRKRRR